MSQGIKIGSPASEEAADSLRCVEVFIERCECHYILSGFYGINELQN